MKKSFVLLITLTVSVFMSLNASLHLPDIISDYMVLQQQDEVHLWGWSEAREKVLVSASWGVSCSATADEQGFWLTTLSTPAASYAPQTLTFRAGKDVVTLHDVLIGEVWLGSGQSNMEMPLQGFWECPIKDANQVIMEAGQHKGHVRYCTVEKNTSLAPLQEAKGVWKECTPANAPDFGAAGYFFALQLEAALQVPVGFINCSWGGTRIEAWMPREMLETYSDIHLEQELTHETIWMRPLLMYNAMLYPVHYYTIKGWLWYQGCSSIGLLEAYGQRQAEMIRHWRDLWGRELPFFFAEIAPFRHGDADADWAARLRTGQWQTMQLVEKCAGLSTNDLVQPYEIDNVHPADKLTVGQRYAFLALHHTYGWQTVYADSPQIEKVEKKGNDLYLYFSNAREGFSRYHGIEGFEVAGEDGVYVPAQVRANSEDKSCLIISSPAVAQPQAVQYCYRNFKIGNLANIRYLPVVPFRYTLSD